MFMGEYNHSVDAKGRLIIPVSYREALGNEFVVTKGLDRCLFAFPKSEWQIMEEKLKVLPITSKGARDFIRYLVPGATICELDRQGRILLPARLREYAGLEKDVVLAGMLSRVEIWNKDSWQAYTSAEDMDAIAQQLADLGLNI